MCVCCYFNTSINCVKLNAKVFLGPIFWLEPCLCSQFHPCAMSHSIRPLYILKLLTGEVNKIISITMQYFAPKCLDPAFIWMALWHIPPTWILLQINHTSMATALTICTPSPCKKQNKKIPQKASRMAGVTWQRGQNASQVTILASIFLKRYRSSSAQLRIRGFGSVSFALVFMKWTTDALERQQ